MFVLLSDMTGQWNISQTKYGNTDLQLVIDTTVEKILKDLLGEDLYLKLIAGPTTSPYADLVNGKTYSVVNGDGVTVNVEYKGIKDMLKYFCYAEILKYQDNKATEIGQVEPLGQSSERMVKNQLNRLIETAYNKGVTLYGINIEAFQSNDSFIRGRRFRETLQQKSQVDYYKYYVRGNCFNFLYNYKANYPTWQFTDKEEMIFGGWL